MFASLRKWAWVLLPVLAVVRPAWAADAVAMVTDIKGAATLAEKGSPEKLALLAYLMPGSEIRVEGGARLVITYFSTPQEFVFTGPAKVQINADGPRVLAGGAAETRSLGQEKVGVAKKFSAMQREKLSQATFEMRGIRAGVRLLDPVDTLLSVRTPEFAWFGPRDAIEYHFTLSEDGGRVMQDLKMAQSAWHVPEAASLEYGKSYQWKVETTLPSGETLSAAGRFTLVDEMKARKIAEAHPKPDAEFSERVLYAARLETEGLKHEAKAKWRALARERPDDPALQEQASR